MTDKISENEQNKQISLSDLLCCPFCNGNVVTFDENKHYVKHKKKCYILSLYMYKIDKVWINDINKWNTRAT